VRADVAIVSRVKETFSIIKQMNLFPKVLATLLVSTAAIFYLTPPTQSQEVNSTSQPKEAYPFDGNVMLTSQSLQGIEAKNSDNWLWASNQNAQEMIDLNLSQKMGVGEIIIGGNFSFPDEFFHDDKADSGRITLFEF
jgi:hypothetical protein